MPKINTHTEQQGPSFSDLVLYELDYRHSRENVSLVASDALPAGMVLMRTASGEYEPLKETSGTLGDARAVLIQSVAASTSSQSGLVVRRSAILNGAALAFDTSVTKQSEAKLALCDLGIVIKE